jgi:hypothetical protein
MSKLKFACSLVCLLSVMTVVSVPAHAVTDSVQVLTAGSSAQWGVFAEAAYQLAKAGGNAKHFTVKGGIKTCGSTGNGGCSFLHDSRNANILDEPGNLWVVWSATTGQIWAYLSVDSTVGVRTFNAFPRAVLDLVPLASLPAAGSNALHVWDDKSSDSALDPNVFAAINHAALTAANTDIRPEDALGTTNRTLAALNTTNYDGLGYEDTAHSSGTCLIGFSYASEVTTTTGPIATPVSFALSGTDPCSGEAIPTSNLFQTIPVGAAPIVIIVNDSNTAAGHLGNSSVNNITVTGTNNVAKLFDGTTCDAALVGGSASVPVTAVQREPLSGTMNTFEWTNVRLNATPTLSQEKGVNGTSGSFNPLNLNCTAGGGKRIRGIGTGDIVKGVNATPDSIGYVFFSYEALIPGTGNNAANIKYLKLDGVDPLATSATSTYTGALPVCGTSTLFSCPITTTLASANGKITAGSFFELREGNYRSWSQYRMISDSNIRSGLTKTNAALAQALVTQAGHSAVKTLPDFVPFGAVCSTSSLHDEPGLSVYRDHFEKWTDGRTVAATENDGAVPAAVKCITGGARTLFARTYGGGAEAGGDVGGVINAVGPQTTNLPFPSTHVGLHQ